MWVQSLNGEDPLEEGHIGQHLMAVPSPSSQPGPVLGEMNKGRRHEQGASTEAVVGGTGPHGSELGGSPCSGGRARLGRGSDLVGVPVPIGDHG